MKVFFVLAGLLITFVMIRTVLLGVHLPERAIVKWSPIEDVTDTSARIADFLYPMLKQQYGVCINDEPAGAQAFVAGLKARLKARNLSILTFSSELAESGKCFSIYIRQVAPETFRNLCPQGDSLACVGLRALKKLDKKNKQPNQDWVSLYRLDNQKAVLFYLAKKTER